MRVESAVMPEYKEFLRGQIFVNFNVETEVTEDGTKYVYEQLRFNPPMSDEALDKEVAKYKEAVKPKVVTVRQARLQLLAMGLLDDVEEMLAADRAMSIWWEYSTEINMYNDMTKTIATKLGLTPEQLDDMFKVINEEGKGAIIFINQDMQSVNLLNRITELKALQGEGEMKAPKIVIDNKDFGIGAQILHDIDISKIRLLSNSEQTKRVGMIGYGLEITEYVKY